ncbi:unnamed protein product [Litomosoides sigmodontis]|uniref:Uncharacterized protein n=1 Tax=Litomosoides sigmodontis TaxID=42156 RepID=A0A3P6S2F0_LITSI|nr:unnamed protein product [Litomosoides sigmodontis]
MRFTVHDTITLGQMSSLTALLRKLKRGGDSVREICENYLGSNDVAVLFQYYENPLKASLQWIMIKFTGCILQLQQTFWVVKLRNVMGADSFLQMHIIWHISNDTAKVEIGRPNWISIINSAENSGTSA